MNKLRVMQMIEDDLKFPMRIFLGLRIENNYETDRRTSKHNHGSRKGFSIDSSLLEKKLIFDLARKIEESFACTISDLDACYDR